MAFAGVIPEAPGFGTQLARGIGQGFSKGIGSASDFADKMALQKQKNSSTDAFLAKMTGGDNNESIEGFKPLPPQQEAALALTNPSAFKAYEVLKGNYEKKEETATKLKDTGNILNSLTKTLLEGNLGYTPKKYITAKGRRDKQYFDSLKLDLESIGKEMVSKGVLARDRFNFLLGTLPSSDKSDAANAGAIEAWAEELKLPVPEGVEKLYGGKRKKLKETSEEPMVKMKGPDGSEAMVPKSKVNDVIGAGGKVIK